MSGDLVVVIGVAMLVALILVSAVCVYSSRRASRRSIRLHAASRELRRDMAAAAMMDSRDVDELLAHLGRNRWTLHAFPNREAPDVLGYTRNHGSYWDVVLLRAANHAAAYRVPAPRRSVGNVLAPDMVVWAWIGDVGETLRQLFALPLPTEANAPTWLQPAPPGCGISAEERHCWTMRPLGGNGKD